MLRNADVYQALAYALTAGAAEAHLLYVSGDRKPRRHGITVTGRTLVAHVVRLGGGPKELVAAAKAAGWASVAGVYVLRTRGATESR